MDSTLAIATPISQANDWLSILLPYLSPFGVLCLILAWMFRSEIKVWLTTYSKNTISSDLSRLQTNMEEHIRKEEDYWKEYDRRLGALEINNVETRTTLERNHEETVRSLADISNNVGRLTDRLIEHIDRGRV